MTKPRARSVAPILNKVSLTIRLDARIVEHYRNTGARWQTRLNNDLLEVVRLHELGGDMFEAVYEKQLAARPATRKAVSR